MALRAPYTLAGVTALMARPTVAAVVAFVILVGVARDTTAYDAGLPCDPNVDKYRCAQTYNYWDQNTAGWYITARNYNGSLGSGGFNRWYLDHHDTWSYWQSYGSWVQISHISTQGPYTNQTFFASPINLGSTSTAGYYVYTYYCFLHHADGFWYFDPQRGWIYQQPVDQLSQIRHELHTGGQYNSTGCNWS